MDVLTGHLRGLCQERGAGAPRKLAPSGPISWHLMIPRERKYFTFRGISPADQVPHATEITLCMATAIFFNERRMMREQDGASRMVLYS